jgi:hypothetical protein
MLLPTLLSAGGYLFYGEAQMVGGWSNRHDTPIFYSSPSPKDVMQKPSIGFDYVQRFSSDTRDLFILAVQGRAAWNESVDPKIEPQLYNGYLKWKGPGFDLWAGHNRTAVGINSGQDSHGILLHNLTMHGFGYDRDWGAGALHDFAWGNLSASATTGTGMPLKIGDNHLYAARLAYGVPERDNFSIGLSGFTGEIVPTVGYSGLAHPTQTANFVGLDVIRYWNRFEVQVDSYFGKKEDNRILIGAFRGTVNLLAENRLKLQLQVVPMRIEDTDRGNLNTKLGAGTSFQITSDLAVRALYETDHDSGDTAFLLQFYYYRSIRF